MAYRIFLLSLLFLCACSLTVQSAESKLFPFKQGGKWGFVDKQGKVSIPAQYDCVWDFSEGLACVQLGLVRGYIDEKGSEVVKPQYIYAFSYSEGLALVYSGGERWGSLFVFGNGSGKWKFIDKTGKVAFEPKIQIASADSFHQGFAAITYPPVWRTGHLTKDGTFREQKDGVFLGPYSEGMAVHQTYHAKFGYINLEGQPVTEKIYDSACPFSQGLARVQTGGTWQYVDKSGKVAIGSAFPDARDFSEGFASVQMPPAAGSKVPGKWGCIDTAGKIVIEPKYDFIGPFSEGRARIVVAGKHGFINLKGEVVIEPSFDLAWEFSNGLARVMVGSKIGYIDPTGKFIWAPTE